MITKRLASLAFSLFVVVFLCAPMAWPTNLEVYQSYALPEGALGIFIEGNLAYIANDLFGIQIIDITDPYGPFTVGSYDTPGFTRSVFVRGGYAYVADGDMGLTILDVSTPSSPTFMGS